MKKGLDVTGRKKYTMALWQSFFSFTYKVPFKPHPEIGISVAQLNLKVISKTTHSSLSNCFSQYIY